MSRYLLIAEADKIQDFLFQASRLQEVMGGSQLLSRFCAEIPGLMDLSDKNTLVHAGGKFIIEFDDFDKAKIFGDQLAEAYYKIANGSITIAPPIKFEEPNFSQAVEKAEEELRIAKRWSQNSSLATVHNPYLALCASCGTGLAITHQRPHQTETSKYLCQSCLKKSKERIITDFLDNFKDRIGPRFFFQDTTRPEDVSHYDPRRYVAYIVADGNNMGHLFKACSRNVLKELSKTMQDNILPESLADATKILMRQTEFKEQIPVYPLILGGDDLFVLLPASWALDFALHFCQSFERRMAIFIQEKNLTTKDGKPFKPTMSAGVVICKETYPYKLAHQIGEDCLNRAKQFSKILQYETDLALSSVDFEVITNNQVLSQSENDIFRPTLRPYYVLTPNENISLLENDTLHPLYQTLEKETSSQLKGWGKPLHTLILQRWALRDISQKRLQLFHTQFRQLPEDSSDRSKWAKEFDSLLQRTLELTHLTNDPVKKAVIELGSQKDNYHSDYLFEVIRSFEKESWYGHGFPDLFEIWDFALLIDKQRSEYGVA